MSQDQGGVVEEARASFLHHCLRWLCISALAYLGCVLYLIALLGVIRLLSPEFLAEFSGSEMGDFAFSDVLRKAWRWWGYLGIVLSPCVGLSVVRTVNESLTDPKQDAQWWKRSHQALGILFLIVMVISVVFGLLAACPSLIRGHGWPQARAGFSNGLLWGSIVGASVLVLGPVVSPWRRSRWE
jgi:hypothetical protein